MARFCTPVKVKSEGMKTDKNTKGLVSINGG